MGTGALYTEIKRPWLEADNSSSPSAVIKNGGPIPPLAYMSSGRGAEIFNKGYKS
jgi:hypothetical protein